jgi:glutamine synthetase
LKSGVECEFFLITPDGNAISDGADKQKKPCYDQLMRQYDIISEICDAMLALGWGPYQNDHEDANGQFEMNWQYAPALVTADRHAFFKFMVKSIAESRPACHVHAEAVPRTHRLRLPRACFAVAGGS